MARKLQDLNPIFDRDKPLSPERALVAVVLYDALLDATAPLIEEARRWHKPPRGAVSRSEQTRARLWIVDNTTGQPDHRLTFLGCCSTLNLNPERVRKTVIEEPRALWARLKAEGSPLSTRRRTRERR